MPQRKLAIICTHPIQYYAPVFRALAMSDRIHLRVFYTYCQAASDSHFDPGFGAEVKWDVPLLEGYAYQFVRNVAKRPGLDHFGGVNTPALAHEIEDRAPDAVVISTLNSQADLEAALPFQG